MRTIARGIAPAMLTLAFAANAQPVFGAVAQWGEEVPCATFRVSGLPPGTRVTIEAFDPRRTIEARIQGRRQPCERGALEGSAYSLAVPTGTTDIFVAPAVLTRSADAAVAFDLCTSMEGIHLLARRGQRRIWHEYFHLGYDVEPSCTPAQLAE